MAGTNCPECSSVAKCQQTISGSNRQDGRTYRRYRCIDPECNYTWSTRECHVDEVTSAPTPVPPVPPLPTPPPRAAVQEPAREAAPSSGPPVPPGPGRMIDLEHEMESILPDAITALRECVRATDPSRARVEAAWRVISDRREYRMRLAEQANRMNEVPSDPAMAQLANILRLVPDAEAVES